MTLGVAIVTFALGAAPLGADPWEPPSSGGGGGGGGFDAWAYWAAATGGQGTPTPETCTLRPLPGRPDPPPPAHIEYVGYELPPGSGHYSVWRDCVADGQTVNPDLPNGTAWDALANWQVEAGDPEELINQALAHINPTPPAIGTSPAGDVASLVGVSTWFWLEGGVAPTSATITDGPLAVTVTATPVSVRWDPGDGGAVVCRDPSNVGVPGTDTCSYTYPRSSLGQAGTDGAGRPAYTVSAEIEYIGGYSVSLYGVPMGGQDNIGGVARVSETTIAVNEAQAINTGSG